MPNIILIGGKDPLNNDYSIEEFVSKYEVNPRILFFPTASMDSEKSINNLIKQFSTFNIEYKFMLLYSNPTKKEINELLDWANILYFAGGNTNNLVNMIKEYKIDLYLKDTNKLLVGISAGAIMMCKSGMGDSYSYNDNGHTYNYKMVDGIGLLDITFCPHYDTEDLVVFNDVLKDYNLDSLALENDTAIYIGDRGYKILKSNNKKSIYYFDRKKDYIMKSLYDNKLIAALGPEGTYCDLACKKFINNSNEHYDINYYPTIRKTVMGIEEVGMGVIPFENTLDGYVLDAIDTLINSDYHIIGDVLEKVEFAFVTNEMDITKVKNVFVQFKAKKECLDFLTINNNFNLIITDSNMESLNKFNEIKEEGYGAIIPMHKLEDYSFNTVIKSVDDKESNYTRFVIVSKNKIIPNFTNKVKCSLGVFMNEDRPGLLFELLKKFNEYGLNLNAIISRPTKEALGKYNFYIEIMALSSDVSNINKCVDELSNSIYKVKNLGIYSSIE